MKIQSISSQQNFTGKAQFLMFDSAQAAKIRKAVDAVHIAEKSYDLFISEAGDKIAITVKRGISNSPVEPRMTTLVNRNQDSFERSVKSTMENYEGIVNGAKISSDI